MRHNQHQNPSADITRLRKRRNVALALALFLLAVIFYAVSFVKTREQEDRRHQQDPQAHTSGASKPTTLP